MAALGVNKSIARNKPIKLNDAVVTGPGTLDFDCPTNTGDFSGLFQVVGTVTTLTADLQISLDNAVTFNNLVTNFLIAGAGTQAKLQTPLVGGARYRINITAASGSQDFWATRN
jgi:hypothetical protein